MPSGTRRWFLASGAISGTAVLAGCSELGELIERSQPAEFPEEPPDAAVETAKQHILEVGRGNYESACRDRCLLAIEDGEQQLEAEEMDDDDLREWAREAEEWYGSAGFRVESVEHVGSEKMDPQAVGAQGYDAGYYLDFRYEGEGNIANPFTEEVVKDDGEWWVLVATF